MPQNQGKKRNGEKDFQAVPQCEYSNICGGASTNTTLNSSGSSNGSLKSRKRKRCDTVRFSDLESEFEDCDLEDAAALETKLRKVARKNSLTHEEMMKLLHKFVKNEHILALVTLKAEDELAKEKQKTDKQKAIIITDMPSVPKLTRAKARELNKTPIIKLAPLKEQESEPEIASLIKDDLQSDEEDEEYVFKEEDFVSDDDPNTTASDLESNPRTPQTPASQIDESPIKLSDDGCFKVPFSKKSQELSEELRIAARTRSKFCLQQTTIEDLQSEFVPPDVEEPLEATDLQPIDEDWMQFLNDFTKPLNTSLVADDDDPINDPEYVAAEKVPVDAEELRDVNISKKELTELLAEIYDDLIAEGLSMDTIDLETPRKFLLSFQDDNKLVTSYDSPDGSKNNVDVSRQLDFEKKHEFGRNGKTQLEVNILSTINKIDTHQISEIETECHQITSTNNQNDYTFLPGIMSTPSTHNKQANDNGNSYNMALVPIAQSNNNEKENPHDKTIVVASSALNTELELIAVPIPGKPNCFQLAKVLDNPEHPKAPITSSLQPTENSSSTKNLRNTKTYLWVKRHVIAEYIDKFKTLQYAQDNKISSTTTETTIATHQNTNTGFTQYQYDMMQQQLRIHIQQLTQTFVQTYCHPDLWRLAPKPKELLLDLHEKSKENANFQVWNLKPAIELIHNWQNELDQDTPENKELMNFLHNENSDASLKGRRIPRFHPRILDCYLNSPVFMYPQYLPRMPFSTKTAVPIFSPVEAYLIAMGLEKHLKIIYEKREKISKSTPLRVACKRLSKDTVCGKRHRRIWDHIMYLQKVDYYNPIKYFFEHNRAPPVDHDPIWTFHNNVVLPPKDRIPELPLVFQTYLQKKNEHRKPKAKKRARKISQLQVSEGFRNSYIEFVQEAVGQDLPIPNLFYDPVDSSDTQVSDADSNNAFVEKRIKLVNPKPAAKRRLPQSLTINVNYVYGNGLDISPTSNNSLPLLPAPLSNNKYPPRNLFKNAGSSSGVQDNIVNASASADTVIDNFNRSNNHLSNSTIDSTIDLTQNNLNINATSEYPVITYNFDWKTKSLQPVVDITKARPDLPPCSPIPISTDSLLSGSIKNNSKIRACKKVCGSFKLHKKTKQRASAYRVKLYLKRRCEELITAYSLYLDKLDLKYKSYPLIQYYYRNFKALELYTYLLKGLKSICNKNINSMSNTSNNSPNLKRARNSSSNADDESPSSARQVRKSNRQEENFRHMILPDTPEETSRKDAIYAFNFYEKVEEAFKIANKPDDCKKFNAILKSFDPKKDKVSDLYYKLEKLFLPDHPELAQVFLTFLLPAEAAEIGKFFEYFMINNMNTFINKLNIYFNKQPAQIRKVYNCLNDLAEDPDVTMKKVETKILPLLKGNNFLIDWFMQQFPQNAPPERLFSKPEHINLKYQQSKRSGEYVETLTDSMDTATNDVQQIQSCQLRYINGRIFYGSKMLLPAKLSFMAASFKEKIHTGATLDSTLTNTCVHGIREHGEKRLQAAADLTSSHINAIEPPTSDDQDKSEEEDVSKVLVIDTTADEDDSCSSVDLCDEGTLRAHATRLNPSVYSSTCFSSNATSTPNLMGNYQAHHANAKKTCLNFNEEAKLSPRKSSVSSSISTHLNLPSLIAVSVSSSPVNPKEKRKSPSKKTKSPLTNKNLRTSNTVVQPMVVIHEPYSAIQCAKRLKSLIDGEGQQNEVVEEVIDSKEILKIVAKSKNSLRSSEVLAPAQICENIKIEKTEDPEFVTGNSALSPSPFPCLRMEIDSNEEDACNTAPVSDEDCKIEIVTSLTTDTEENNRNDNSSGKTHVVLPLNAAWTRDEDKIILIEMKIGSQNREELFQRIAEKLTKRTMFEITSRHQFLMDFLSKLQGK